MKLLIQTPRRLALLLLLTPFLILSLAAQGAKDTSKKKAPAKKRPAKKAVKVDPTKPMVLIIGDSISIGYTPGVRKTLEGTANVLHNPGNSQGTTHGLANIEKWIADPVKDTSWDVIHFNFGLHDLKRVTEAGTSKNSNDPADPRQANLEAYTANLKTIVAHLNATEANLIFATTTPYPGGVTPHRDPEDPARYNAAALEIMKANDIPVNDLHAHIQPHLAALQRPKNVHFTPEGSAFLAKEVTRHIESALAVAEKE